MQKPKKLVFKFACLCDDVRREDNGKMILIGVYGSDIVLSGAANLLLNMVVWMDIPETKAYDLNVEILIDGVIQNSGKIKFSMTKALHGVGSFPIPLNVSKSGVIDIKIGEDGRPVTNIFSVPVRVG
ncbi:MULTISPECIES: hypothetical protein [unclassified Mesorhizobium]|uniref:hypothetical protein n=1 Tax=unclassified Mesorhizobium TaxID=325217 RepID=UPI000F7586A1|nr:MULTISPECIES: hypothetical protein [unclassified Mesorhizobium]AZO68633.1 hypothetical protein EJ075_29450 [Mesorhizobium sp. M6A.T.Cr.TU.016.01.1.1]RWP52914.1 MAG: hypothetical protein EOR06_18105 [Mesorhizobium sp.]